MSTTQRTPQLFKLKTFALKSAALWISIPESMAIAVPDGLAGQSIEQTSPSCRPVHRGCSGWESQFLSFILPQSSSNTRHAFDDVRADSRSATHNIAIRDRMVAAMN
ncbi:hypothetical protein EN962_07800 [Mesorhizobium sp. M7A.F.Ca.CA.001.09.2.1]|uniref:Transposase n=2 Tax=Mesorhizobium TaxID=68287 RepID=A0AB38TAU1_9HYPH|nr:MULTISPECIES: hypothetical protein [Mesorhizobium]MDF3215058.1 hypothetical protein [Mesorhizobium ciceri]RUY71780.1 hypothetical protein EN965_07500 [Mesorhizobium sp. M7A.F.Ca.CA.001.05.1.1]RUY73219.1 hypothetical protein EN980_00520 [Mesorhizobium sp. M7A.F.Ca.CA.001.13.1.1]RUY79817.1 hypothetical protein EN962_07800 [Mesorhizobium sp. M7A.F.Ca.CA.001.09.2.1]RUZ07722.1 hypothetical protein EN955_10635 [Mesorhizobium sp. M7A.F.Ca.CA.001.04.2.1]